MVVVGAVNFDVQGGEYNEGDKLEKMFGQFGAEIAHFVTFEIGFELDERSAQ